MKRNRLLRLTGVRFLGDGGDGSAAPAGGAPAGDSGAPAGGNEAPAAGEAPAGNDEPPAAPADDEDNGSKADDPKLRAARDEAYKSRQKAKAAEDEKANLIQTLGKALGLVKDDDSAPDADALTAQIAAEQAKTADTARELAIYRAAAQAGADADKLLDSRNFMTSVKDLDPTDAKAVQAAITEAVKSNANFALSRVPGKSTADHASGPGGGSAPKEGLTLAEAVAQRYNH